VSEFFTWPARAHSMRAAGEWSAVGERAVTTSEVAIPQLLAAPHKSHQLVALALQWPVGSTIGPEFLHLRRVEPVVVTHCFSRSDPDVVCGAAKGWFAAPHAEKTLGR
jgi:hypothetical protein